MGECCRQVRPAGAAMSCLGGRLKPAVVNNASCLNILRSVLACANYCWQFPPRFEAVIAHWTTRLQSRLRGVGAGVAATAPKL